MISGSLTTIPSIRPSCFKWLSILRRADPNKVKEHAGQKVTITGKMDGDTIKVDSVKM
jgi:hypothetical protein